MGLGPDAAPGDQRRVVYLLGAGATHGAVKYAGSDESLVMPGLIEDLLDRMRDVYIKNFHDHAGVRHLVNDVVDANTDFEHLLTFLEDAPSLRYQEFATELKEVFSTVLRKALENVCRELGDRHSELYAALVDMHQVEGSDERLAGFLTLNYDSFLEHAIEKVLGGGSVNYGVRVQGTELGAEAIPVLKLHGSFGWRHTWPIESAAEISPGLWIPPGIRKAKADYPFNEIWGAARELLDCDVLRIIGCNLGPNDWDLVSLLFTTMHGRESASSYEVEVVAGPTTASRIAKTFPYLGVRSLLEIPEVGPEVIGEVLNREPVGFTSLDTAEQERAIQEAESKITNPFERWLRLKGELMLRDLETLRTDRGLFQEFVAV